MKDAPEAEPRQRRSRRLMWKEVLFGALLLWIGTTNLGSTLELYAEHRGTLRGVLLLLCECVLLVGSGGAMALGAQRLWMRRGALPPEGPEDWSGMNAKRLRRVALLSFVGLAWCLGSLR